MVSVHDDRALDGRLRVVIERLRPEIDCGQFPIKRVVGETVTVEADVFADGHDQIECEVLYRHEGQAEWQRSPLEPLGNDHWRGEFRVAKLGRYRYTVEGWIDRFKTWRGDLVKRIAAGQDVRVELLIGALIVEDAAKRAAGEGSDDAARLSQSARILREEKDQEAQQAGRETNEIDAAYLNGKEWQCQTPQYGLNKIYAMMSIKLSANEAE